MSSGTGVDMNEYREGFFLEGERERGRGDGPLAAGSSGLIEGLFFSST